MQKTIEELEKIAVKYDPSMLDQIKSAYEISFQDACKCAVIKNKEQKSLYISFRNQKKLYLSENLETPIEIEHANMLVKDLYPEKWEEVKANYNDPRTDKYIEQTKKNIGLLDIKHGWDSHLPKDQIEFGLDIWINLTGSGKVDCGKLEDGRWVAQFARRTDIDDYDICAMFFEKEPTKKMVLIANTVDQAETYFHIHTYKNANFTCWECGIKTHWLDVNNEEPGIIGKWGMLEEKYCGC